jgi:hypothetical protein
MRAKEKDQGIQLPVSLRDYFAAKALPILMYADTKRWEGHYEIHAEQAYKFADAMIKAREINYG